jgi:hypothetical protein
MLAGSLLGVPHRITGDARVSFRGSGRARFRLQHAGSYNGEPDPWTWVDVSMLSNGALADPAEAIAYDCMVRGVLVDVVDGDIDVLYRRHSADWLRVIPLDVEDDDANTGTCARYEISIEPIGQRD